MRNGSHSRYNRLAMEDSFSIESTQTQPPLQVQKAPQAHYSVLGQTTGSSGPSQRHMTNAGGQNGNIFTKHYKDITFDTLKERHDNFCFEKVLQTKNQVYNTMHFTGIIEKPNNPNLILFMKQAGQEKINREQFSNSKYQNMTDSMSFYDAFAKRMNVDSQEQPRPRIGVTGEAFELTTDGVQREGTATSEDAYALMSQGGLNSKHEQRPFRMGSGKNSMTYQSGVASSGNNHYNTNGNGNNAAAATRQERESDMWHDFKKHFGNRARQNTPQNHHDFLDVIKHQRESIEHSQGAPYSRHNRQEGNHLLAVNRIDRAFKNYNQMKLNSITMPVKKKGQVNKDALAEKGRQRQKLQEELQRQKQIEWVQGLKSTQGPESPLRTRDKRFNNYFSKRLFPERHIFVILDGQNLSDINKELKFSYIEINTRLCKTIPQKIWDSQQAQSKDLYHRVDLANPSSLMMKQLILEINDEVNTKHKLDKNPMAYAWLLDGTRIKSLMDIHQQSRVIVVSRTKQFEGIKGLESLSGYADLQHEAARKVQPKPATWIQTAAVSWFRQNDTLDMANQIDTSQAFSKSDSVEVQQVESQGKMIDAIRNEHARVYLQDQALLKTIKEHDSSVMGGITLTNIASAQSDQGDDFDASLDQQVASPMNKRSIATAEGDQTVKDDTTAEGQQLQNTEGATEEIVDVEAQPEQSIPSLPPTSKELLATFRMATEHRRKQDPIYAIKSISLVESEMEYDYASLEDSLINLLLEKVVVMREVPFVRAMEQLERNVNVNKIYDQISKVTGVGGFAGRQYTKKWQQALANRDQYQQTQPYEGPSQGLTNSEAVSDTFAQNRAGRATFKIKQDDGKESSNQAPSGEQDKDKVAQTGRMLRNEEIKEICEKHALKRNEVYQIRSQFASMCTMSEQYMAQLEKEKEQDGLPEQYQRKPMKTARSYNLPTNTQQNNTGHTEPKEDGISIDYFIKFCSFLSGSLPHINKRILVAQGIDVQNQNVHVNWQTYLELYCIFEAGQVQKSHLIRFWIKFFDQSLSGKCPKEEYLSLLEELVRGVSLPKPQATTKLFAQMFQKQMARQACLDENLAIITDKLALAFEEGRLDIQLLCSALGRQPLDPSFLNEVIDDEM